MRVFVTGATGLIGRHLVSALRERGHDVLALVRRPESAASPGEGVHVVPGDAMTPGPWQDVAAGCDAVVNLAGENIFNRRWSTSFRELIRASRVQATEHCVQAVSKHPRRADGQPKVLVNASAVGWYGPRGDEEIDESATNGNDFLAGVCRDWENAARVAAQAGVRVVLARIGVVLDRAGGALQKVLLPFKLCMGGPVGSGGQYFPWVHHADVVGIILQALANETVMGPVNVVGPRPVTNREFGKALGRALHRPAFVWTPGFMLRLGMGGAAEVITTGQRVLPKRALAAGYVFQYPTIEAALAEIFTR